jgi:hypothetical protein
LLDHGSALEILELDREHGLGLVTINRIVADITFVLEDACDIGLLA